MVSRKLFPDGMVVGDVVLPASQEGNLSPEEIFISSERTTPRECRSFERSLEDGAAPPVEGVLHDAPLRAPLRAPVMIRLLVGDTPALKLTLLSKK